MMKLGEKFKAVLLMIWHLFVRAKPLPLSVLLDAPKSILLAIWRGFWWVLNTTISVSWKIFYGILRIVWVLPVSFLVLRLIQLTKWFQAVFQMNGDQNQIDLINHPNHLKDENHLSKINNINNIHDLHDQQQNLNNQNTNQINQINQINKEARFNAVNPMVQMIKKQFLLIKDYLYLPSVRYALLFLLICMGWVVISTPFSWLGQLFFLFLCWLCAMVLRDLPGVFPSLALVGLSLLALGRYVWWRFTTTLEFNSSIEAILGYGLLAAEFYTWFIVLLGFIQTAWPLKRQSVSIPLNPQNPDPNNTEHWPSVDVFIPTYNEPQNVVYPTLLAALELDWPREKLNIYLLDDGKRETFRLMAEELGIGYITRPNNHHAKAGNLNHALKQTNGDFVAIFDCDHIPTQQFLTATAGQMMREPQCAMVQTPHHFFSPDPFERNLGTFRRVPNEGALFYGLVQDGNDFWNATFFCGSCALIRREPLMKIGGIAIETVTEDAHTALKLHRLGYTTAYLNQTLAAGLATESLSAHIGQRIRWARGMAQIFRLDNPFLGKGLSIWQRICYSNAMLHFFFGLPRLVFLTAPMTFLFFEWHVISTHALLLALYVMPYIIQSSLANAHIQGEHRHTFWAEVYETVLAWYVTPPTTVAMFNPKAGSFNVTAKGGLVEESYFDWGISKPYLLLVILNLAAFLVGLMRLFFWNTHETATVLLNLIWTTYSIFMLGAALGVASETKQIRRTHRVACQLPAAIYLNNGQVIHAQCVDFSMTGVGLKLNPSQQKIDLKASDKIEIALWREHPKNGRMTEQTKREECIIPATTSLVKPTFIGVQFESLTKQEEINLVQCTFARPGAWNESSGNQEPDRPLQGLQEIVQLGWLGYKNLAQIMLKNGVKLIDLIRQKWQTHIG